MSNPYFSQFKQDEFLDQVIFNKKKNGFFIDIGAHDGLTISNTLYFEKTKGWTGICIEPNPTVFQKLQQNRQSKNLNVCVGNGNKVVKFTKIDGYSEMLSGITDAYNEKHLERIRQEVASKGGNMTEIDVPMVTLESIPELLSQPIDFISIDTEGNEFDIVKSIDFSKLKISALVVENNYGDERIKKYLSNLGYGLLHKLDCDEVYLINNEFNFGVALRLLSWKAGIIVRNVFSKFARQS